MSPLCKPQWHYAVTRWSSIPRDTYGKRWLSVNFGWIDACNKAWSPLPSSTTHIETRNIKHSAPSDNTETFLSKFQARLQQPSSKLLIFKEGMAEGKYKKKNKPASLIKSRRGFFCNVKASLKDNELSKCLILTFGETQLWKQ